MGLGARRLYFNQPRKPGSKLNQDCNGSPAARGEIILIYPSGTRSEEDIAFKRGAATLALHARVPLVPAFYQGPKHIQVTHLARRPLIRVIFGSPIPTAGLPPGKATALDLTRQLKSAITELRLITDSQLRAA